MSETLVKQVESDGFAVIEDFVTADDIREMYSAGSGFCNSAPAEDRKSFSTTNSECAQNRDDYFIGSVDKVRYFFEKGAIDEEGKLLVDVNVALNKVGHALHIEHPLFRRITFSDKVRDICKSFGFRKPAVVQSMYIFKNPGVGSEVVPHQDATFIYTEPNSALGFWIALEPATKANGCLDFIKSSHNDGVHCRYIRNPDKNAAELLIYDRPTPKYAPDQFDSVPVAEGSCVLIHSAVVHKSEPNKSTKSRHAYAFHVVETDRTEFSKDNWLQLPAHKSWPYLY